MTASVIKATVFEDGGAIALARILGWDGSAIEQSEVTSITCAVTNITTGSPVSVITPSITVSDVIFDTLQTTALWTKDSTGFNFKHALPATAFPTGNNVYRVEYKFTPTAGAVFYVVFQVTAEATTSD
jgi:hypothetical protein